MLARSGYRTVSRLPRLRHMFRAMSLPAIVLNQVEADFVNYLDQFAQTRDPPVECRIAGGWVRDKLLSLPSSDLDVALSISSGYIFACEFVDYLRQRDVSTRSVGRVAANPEQSKHLETGTTSVMGLECDFVGLRSESYSGSRIPSTVKLGTPLEDAERRDLTINSLFYNVHSKSIEDWTGHGLEDLGQRIARTPLAPRQTFLDDPLRVVRCIRFASRFGLKIEDDIVKAIKDEDIKEALRTKVSKERIGIEVRKIMQKTPFDGIALIDRLGLHGSMFACPNDTPRDTALSAAKVLCQVKSTLPAQLDEVLWLSALLFPFHDLVVPGKRPMPVVSVVLGEGLKLPNDIRDAVTRLFTGATILSSNKDVYSRSGMGLLLRHTDIRPWERTLCWAAVMEIMTECGGAWNDRADEIIRRYRDFHARVLGHGLERDIDTAPLLDGKAIQGLLNLKPGPIVQVIRDKVVEWQLDNPKSTEVDCQEWLEREWVERKREEWESVAAVKRRK